VKVTLCGSLKYEKEIQLEFVHAMTVKTLTDKIHCFEVSINSVNTYLKSANL